MDTKDTQTEPKATSRRPKPIVFVIIIAVIIGLYFGGKAIYHAIYYESTDNAQVESFSVPVLSRVSGYVDSLPLTDYQSVKAGQLVAHIDDKEYKIAVDQAQADLLSAQADLTNADASLNNATVNKSVAQANADVQLVKLQKNHSDLLRDSSLYKEASITQKQYDDTRANYTSGQKQYEATKQQVLFASSQINTAQAQIQKAEAAIKQKQAALDNAKLKVSYTTITAPEKGKAGKINIQPGQYVQAGQTLFTIVDDTIFWVVANFKETQLDNLRLGQVVDVSIDGYPDLKVKGKISSMSEATGAKFSLLPPDNATGNFVKVTQRVPIKIDLDDQKALRNVLKAGLSVYVDIKVK